MMVSIASELGSLHVRTNNIIFGKKKNNLTSGRLARHAKLEEKKKLSGPSYSEVDSAIHCLSHYSLKKSSGFGSTK